VLKLVSEPKIATMSSRKTTLIFALLILIPLSNSCGLFKSTSTTNTPTTKNETYSKAYTPDIINKVVTTARLFLGTPYKFSGTTEDGIDCSGLMTLAYNAAGLKIPRASYDIAKLGKDIPLKQARKGDLLFFNTMNTGKISHVGIVVSHKSDKEMIFVHASNSGVNENNFYTPYYQKAFVKVTRPF
jgi:cell wall-associated NlpC family hydrolase